MADARHLLIGTSLPVFVAGGIHDLQRWNERVCDGAWGRLGAAARARSCDVGLDLEHWPAFGRSFDAMVALLADLGNASRRGRPASISVLSGDIHFSYHSEIEFPAELDVATPVHQLVNSPIRNALRPHERATMRFALSRIGRRVGRVLRWSVRNKRPGRRWSSITDRCSTTASARSRSTATTPSSASNAHSSVATENTRSTSSSRPNSRRFALATSWSASGSPLVNARMSMSHARRRVFDERDG